MRHAAITATALMLALSACAPAIPDSGAGLDSYDGAQRATVDAQLEGRTDPATGRSTAAAGATAEAGSSAAPAAGGGEEDIAEMAARALARDQNSGQSPVDASPSNPVPSAVETSGGMSAENDFDAVSNERSIEQDAALLAQNRAQYQQVQPSSVPQSSGGPNIVAYALETTNQVGQAQYSRSAFASKSREARNCNRFSSADAAQEAFLEAGGPQKDREGLDSDGDGFACGWNPAPYRRIRG